MKNSYEHDYPNAWKDWYDFSRMDNIEFQEFHNWCNARGLSVAIVEYPDVYSVRVVNENVTTEFGQFDTWFDALDATVEHVFRLVEEWYSIGYELAGYDEASKELGTTETSKEGILKHYNMLILEIGDHYKELLERVKDGKEPEQVDLDSLDSIVIVALACKRLLTE